MSTYAVYNGIIVKEESICISPNNRSFRYGDGFFETMKVINSRVVLDKYHYSRFFTSLSLMGFDRHNTFSAEYFNDLIRQLVKKNAHQKIARVRLTVFRGDGGLYDTINHSPNYIIQSWSLQDSPNQFNVNGLVTDVYTAARKSTDDFSALKHNNFLCYAMGALWVKQQKLNDCIILNNNNNVADSTIANVFIVSDKIIKTPPLQDGPVSGVMRKYLLNKFKEDGYTFLETSINIEDVKQASEIFFTNAIYGIKWVKSFANQHYTNTTSKQLYDRYISPLYML